MKLEAISLSGRNTMDASTRVGGQARGWAFELARATRCLLLLILVAGCSPPSLEEAGGYILVYDLEQSHAPPNAMAEAVERRLQQFGLRGATARILKSGQLELSLAGADQEEVEQTQRLVETAGVLEFRILAQPGTDDDIIAAFTSQEMPADEERASETKGSDDSPKARWINYDLDSVQLPPDVVTRKDEDAQPQVLVLVDSFNVTGEYLRSVSQDYDASAIPCISGSFNQQGATRMSGLTSSNLPSKTGKTRALGIILDDHLVSAPHLRSTIGERFQISGSFSKADTTFLVAVLRAGRLPVRVKEESAQVRRVAPKQ